MDQQSRPDSSNPPILNRLFAQLLGTLLLMATAIAIPYIECWGLFALAILGAWPIWVYATEVALFERRVLLGHLTHTDSSIRHFFWTGTLKRVIQTVVSLFLSALLVILATRLTAEAWLLLVFNSIVLSLAVEPFRRRLAKDVSEEHLGLVNRRWVLLTANIAFLTLAFFLLDFFSGVPDTRQQTWSDVVEQSFYAEADTICPFLGWLIGTLAAADALVWHLSQITIPQLPDRLLKLLAWAIVLLHSGILAYVFTRLQLGIMILVERRAAPSTTESTLSRSFVYTIILLALPIFYAYGKLIQTDWTKVREGTQDAIKLTDPCQLDPVVRNKLLASMDENLQAERVQAREVAAQKIDEGLEQVIKDLEPAVDRYLDWYFTVVGEYERLAALATGNISQTMQKRLQEHVFEETHFPQLLQTVEHEATIASGSVINAAVANMLPDAMDKVRPNACQLGQFDAETLSSGLTASEFMPNFERDLKAAATAVGGGTAVAAASMKVFARKAGTVAVSKAVATKSFQAAVGLAAKFAAKKGGGALVAGATGAAICSPGGPAAIVCGVVAGVVTWITIDKIGVEIDEHINRDEMKEDILQAIRDTTPEIALELQNRQYSWIDASFEEIRKAMPIIFIPGKDGI